MCLEIKKSFNTLEINTQWYNALLRGQGNLRKRFKKIQIIGDSNGYNFFIPSPFQFAVLSIQRNHERNFMFNNHRLRRKQSRSDEGNHHITELKEKRKKTELSSLRLESENENKDHSRMSDQPSI